MDLIDNLLSYSQINEEWINSNQSEDSAKFLTFKQVENFENIVKDDDGWKELIEIFNNGRDIDAWLAMDWPDGFDELLLCVPLCKFINFECSKCTVGKRQDNNSCAHDNSLFGYVAELLKESDRRGLLDHLDSIKKIILIEDFKWNIEKKILYQPR